jgi:hypothetical protein
VLTGVALFGLWLVVAELVVRAIPTSFLKRVHAVGFFQTEPYAIDSSRNSLGFRGTEPRTRRDDVERVLLLGDSFAVGASVPWSKTVGPRLEHWLERKTGRPHEVIVLALPGWGQRDELEALRELGPELAPGRVVTLFLKRNDVMNNFPELHRVAGRELRAGRGEGQRRRSGSPWLLLPGSALNRLLVLRIDQWQRDRHDTTMPRRMGVYRDPPTPDWVRAWRHTRDSLRATRDLARRLGADYSVVSASTPDGVLGDAGLAELLEAHPEMRKHRFDFDLPDRRLAKICRALGVPFLALEPGFRTATSDGERLHSRHDGHWNAAGHDRAGRRMAELLGER